MTRYFGKTAAKDSFEIYDLTNRTKETAFSEKLGEELFGLDAESFARSTFVPQLAARELGGDELHTGQADKSCGRHE